MWRTLYSLLLYCALPFILIRLLYRSRNNINYRKRIKERFGLGLPPILPGSIWLHTVSVGEFIAAKPLIQAIEKKWPEKQIFITCMTPSGSEQISKILSDKIHHAYLPYDLPCRVKKFLKQVRPSALILMETELWPNLLHYTHKSSIPILLANARLSEKSCRGYERIGTLAREMLNNISLIGVQNDVDKARFVRLGMPKERLITTGSIKFDLSVDESLLQDAATFRAQIGGQRPIWLAASTHESEEQQVLSAFAEVKKSVPNALLLLVPRHLERFDKVADLVEKAGYSLVRYSGSDASPQALQNCEVYLGDVIGKLMLFYGASDFCFIGGSLVSVGGHNMLEPAALSKASIIGPHYFNFADIVEQLKAISGIVLVKDSETLAKQVIEWFHSQQFHGVGQKAQAFLTQHQGATETHLKLLEKIIPN